MSGAARAIRVGLTLLAGAIAVATPALAAEQGNAERGAMLAKRWCASCHVVDATQAKGSVDAPSFAALAAAPGKTAEGFADFLTMPGTTHSKMPDLQLSRVEISDIVAHILAQKK
jgi:mono/diheme cytochrome c family protein